MKNKPVWAEPNANMIVRCMTPASVLGDGGGACQREVIRSTWGGVIPITSSVGSGRVRLLNVQALRNGLGNAITMSYGGATPVNVNSPLASVFVVRSPR